MMVSAVKVNKYVDEHFDYFGQTRRNEVSRLLFEIAKRENQDWQKIVSDYQKEPTNFNDFKKYLIKRRFPLLSNQRFKISLPKLDVNSGYRVKLSKREILLKNVYIEKAVKDTDLANRLKTKFPEANFEIINFYRDHVKNSQFGIADYNRRLDSFYIIEEKFDFYKKCPCSSRSVSCSLHIMNFSSGCAYECSYCFLQDYINSPGIVIPANLEGFFEEFKKYKQDVKIGSGELTDSLVFDHITEYSPRIVDFFKDYPSSVFEFKTKSDNVDLLLKQEGIPNVVIAWSVNPQNIIDNVEHYTASLEERLTAAEKCVQAGYRVAFHFDPIIYHKGWEKGYSNLVNQIFDRIPEKAMETISLGTLRMTPRLKTIIENRFPDDRILDEEFMLGHDKKLRYSHKVRANIYGKMKEWISKRSQSINPYLCMEEKLMCSTTQSAPLKKYS